VPQCPIAGDATGWHRDVQCGVDPRVGSGPVAPGWVKIFVNYGESDRVENSRNLVTYFEMKRVLFRCSLCILLARVMFARLYVLKM